MDIPKSFFEFYETEDLKLISCLDTKHKLTAIYYYKNAQIHLSCVRDFMYENVYKIFCTFNESPTETKKILERMNDWKINPSIRLRKLLSPLEIRISTTLPNFDKIEALVYKAYFIRGELFDDVLHLLNRTFPERAFTRNSLTLIINDIQYKNKYFF